MTHATDRQGTLREETRVSAFDLRDTLLDRESTLVPVLGDLLEAHDGDYDLVILLVDTSRCTSGPR